MHGFRGEEEQDTLAGRPLELRPGAGGGVRTNNLRAAERGGLDVLATGRPVAPRCRKPPRSIGRSVAGERYKSVHRRLGCSRSPVRSHRSRRQVAAGGARAEDRSFWGETPSILPPPAEDAAVSTDRSGD